MRDCDFNIKKNENSEKNKKTKQKQEIVYDKQSKFVKSVNSISGISVPQNGEGGS